LNEHAELASISLCTGDSSSDLLAIKYQVSPEPTVTKMASNIFMIGPAPIRRTLPYLRSCPLIFKERVKVVEVHYNFYYQRNMPKPIFDAHSGLREFYFWNIGQIQYKNPEVQVVRFTEMTPNPFIRCWLDDGSDVLFDCDSKSKEQIMQQLIAILGKSRDQLGQEERVRNEKNIDNPAVFDFNRPRFCICEIPGKRLSRQKRLYQLSPSNVKESFASFS
jgi:small subunit ribosomal protein S25